VGASKHNYTNVLLDLYCLFEFEATPELKDAILHNWVVNLTGKNVPDDQMQEWHNKFHENMVPKHGGSFDDPFFRETISPNVNFFQRLKEEMEKAFGLTAHRKTHTSAAVTSEICALMAMYRRENVHLFCEGRCLGHKVKDLINNGYTTLEKAKMADFQQTSTERAEVLAMIHRYCQNDSAPESQGNLPNSSIPTHTDEHDNSSDSDSSRAEDLDPDGSGEDSGSENDMNDERANGGSAWEFRMDEEDNITWEQEGDEGEEEPGDKEGMDPDVDIDGWAGENDVLE
jgi:hypothetical protein